MSTSAIAAFEAQLRAFNAHDAVGFARAYDETATIRRDELDPVTGRAAIESYYIERFGDPRLRCEAREVHVVGDRWVVAYEIVSSSVGVVEVAAIFEVDAGLIRRASMLTRAQSTGLSEVVGPGVPTTEMRR